MKKLTLLCAGLLIMLGLQAQETYTYSNPSRAFQEGKEQYLQQQYQAATANLKAFLETAGTTDRSRVEEAEYYIASAAFEMRRPEAATLLSGYLQNYPGSPMLDNVNYRLGVLQFENKQYKAAIEHLAKADVKRLKPADAEYCHFVTAYCYMANNEFAQAREQFKPLIDTEKYNKIATYYYGYCEYALENYDAALSSFEKIQNQPEYEALVPYYIIQIYARQKQYAKAMAYGKTIIDKQPDNPKNNEVYRIMGECAYRDNAYSQAVTYFSKAGELPRTSAYMLGMSATKTGNYDVASKALEKVAGTADSMGQNAYLALGNAYMKQKNSLKAQMSYANAGKLTFDKKVQEEALYNYALATSESGSPFGESVKAFDNFLVTFPNSAHSDEINSRLATAFLVSKDYESALTAINKLKTNNPQITAAKENILFHLGVQQFDKKNYQGAINYFTLALAATSERPDMVQIYFWRGESYYRTGQYDRAREDFFSYQNDARSLHDANYRLSNYDLGYCYFKAGDYRQSQLYFLRYAGNEHEAMSPVYIDALTRIGDCLFQARDFMNAHKYYSQVVAKGRPESDYAEYQLAFIYGLQKNYRVKINELEKLIANFPSSEYCDNAYYEIGRSYIILEQYDKAIETYKTLMQKYPTGELSRKAALETGMAYANTNNRQNALNAYKDVVKNYPGSSEAKVAMENIEATYVDMSDADGYLAYRRSLGKGSDLSKTDEDSLVFTTAEKVYLSEKWQDATAQLNRYLSKYCPQGNYCIKATYYLADSYMQLQQPDQALPLFRQLAGIKGNPYMEEALAQCASITFDKKDYKTSFTYFKTLEASTGNKTYREAAKLGMLRCSQLGNDMETTVSVADSIIANSLSGADMVNEARYYRAKALIAGGKCDNAAADLTTLAHNLRTAFGAEAKYLLANCYFEKDDLAKAEAEVLDFINNNTPYQFWLAKSFILLSDIYVKRGDDFQAKQYLLTLRDNYHQQDEIQDIVKQKLQAVEQRQAVNGNAK
jgi:TolA-binding protein